MGIWVRDIPSELPKTLTPVGQVGIKERRWMDKCGSKMTPSTPAQIEEWWQRAEKAWKVSRKQAIEEFDEQVRRMLEGKEMDGQGS